MTKVKAANSAKARARSAKKSTTSAIAHRTKAPTARSAEVATATASLTTPDKAARSARKSGSLAAKTRTVKGKPGRPAPAGGKTASIVSLMRRPAGANLSELMAATGWQSHSVRGVISGVLRKKQGLAVQLVAGAEGMRAYRISA